MTVVWGIVGMAVGVLIAALLVWPGLNEIWAPYTGFGRLRPLHTNAVIFAFGGCALFATSYYVVQRTSQAPLFGGWLVPFTFWGWQAVIVLAARSEEHTSELQSRGHLVCRLLLETKKNARRLRLDTTRR